MPENTSRGQASETQNGETKECNTNESPLWVTGAQSCLGTLKAVRAAHCRVEQNRCLYANSYQLHWLKAAAMCRQRIMESDKALGHEVRPLCSMILRLGGYGWDKGCLRM